MNPPESKRVGSGCRRESGADFPNSFKAPCEVPRAHAECEQRSKDGSLVHLVVLDVCQRPGLTRYHRDQNVPALNNKLQIKKLSSRRVGSEPLWVLQTRRSFILPSRC